MARISEPVVGPMFKRGKIARKTTHVAKDGGYLSFLHLLPCLVSGRSGPVEAAHIRYGAPRYGKPPTGKGEKSDDRWAVPLSAYEHREGPAAQHSMNEREYWRRNGIDPVLVAALLYSAYVAEPEQAALESALKIITNARHGLIKGEFA